MSLPNATGPRTFLVRGPSLGLECRGPFTCRLRSEEPVRRLAGLLVVPLLLLSTAACGDDKAAGSASSSPDAQRAESAAWKSALSGMPRERNHRPRQGTGDPDGQADHQVGRQQVPPITTFTGLRRRERRFESCRWHIQHRQTPARFGSPGQRVVWGAVRAACGLRRRWR